MPLNNNIDSAPSVGLRSCSRAQVIRRRGDILSNTPQAEGTAEPNGQANTPPAMPGHRRGLWAMRWSGCSSVESQGSKGHRGRYLRLRKNIVGFDPCF
jgi:hypothetical protein